MSALCIITQLFFLSLVSFQYKITIHLRSDLADVFGGKNRRSRVLYLRVRIEGKEAN